MGDSRPSPCLQAQIGVGITIAMVVILSLPYYDRVWWCDCCSPNPWGWGWLVDDESLYGCVDHHFVDPCTMLHIISALVGYGFYSFCSERKRLCFPTCTTYPLVWCFALAALFELFENFPPMVRMWSANGGDTISNSVADVLVAWLGWSMARSFPRSVSYSLVALQATLLFFWYLASQYGSGT